MPVCIREASTEDGHALANILGPYILGTAISFHEIPPSGQEMSHKILETMERYPYLVAEENGEVVGCASGGSYRSKACYRWSVEVGVYLAPTHHRQGIGKKLYRRLVELLTMQGFVKAYAGITLPNAASVRLHESVGFKPIGVFHAAGFKLGAWHDVGWWERSLSDPSSNAPEPIPWPVMRRSLAGDSNACAAARLVL